MKKIILIIILGISFTCCNTRNEKKKEIEKSSYELLKDDSFAEKYIWNHKEFKVNQSNINGAGWKSSTGEIAIWDKLVIMEIDGVLYEAKIENTSTISQSDGYFVTQFNATYSSGVKYDTPCIFQIIAKPNAGYVTFGFENESNLSIYANGTFHKDYQKN